MLQELFGQLRGLVMRVVSRVLPGPRVQWSG